MIAGQLGLCRGEGGREGWKYKSEAVSVAAVLRPHSGAVELVDCSDRLLGLKRVPGVSSWKVCVLGQYRLLYSLLCNCLIMYVNIVIRENPSAK